MLCESAGLTAETYDSAESFLRTYDPVKARCLMLDAQLPEMSGLDLLKKLKTERVRLPVIMFSANADTAMVVQAMRLGAADFFDKPFDTHVLLKRILEVIGQGEEINQGLGGFYLDHDEPRGLFAGIKAPAPDKSGHH